MKNKMGFIMPRLVGATVAAGLAALIITTLFKLLLALTIVAGGITLIARSFGKRRQLSARYGQNLMSAAGNRNAFGNSSVWNNPIQPITSHATQKGTSIVPID